MVRAAKPNLLEEINCSMKSSVGIFRNSANRDTGSVADMTDDETGRSEENFFCLFNVYP